MKKVFCLLVALALCFSLSLTAFAANIEDGTLIGDDVKGKAGDSVSFNIAYTENPGFNVIRLRLKYDTSALEFLNAEAGDIQNFTLDESNDKNGLITILGEAKGANNVDTDGILVCLNFKIKDDAKSGFYNITLNCGKEDICNYEEESLEPMVFSPTVTVLCKDHNWDTNNKIELFDGSKGYVCFDCGAYLLESGEIITDIAKVAEVDIIDADGNVQEYDYSKELEEPDKSEGIDFDKEPDFVEEINEKNAPDTLVLIIGIAVIVVIIAGGICFWLITRKKNKDKKQEDKNKE